MGRLPQDVPAAGGEGVHRRLLVGRVTGIARVAVDLAAVLEAAEVAEGGRAVDVDAVEGGGRDEPARETAEDHVGGPPEPPRGRVDRVVGTVLRTGSEEGGHTRRCDSGVGRGPEVHVALAVGRAGPGYSQASLPVAIWRAKTDSEVGGGSAKSQSALSKTTRPAAGSTVPDDQTLPQPSLRMRPLASTSSWYSQIGSPVASEALTT